MTTEQIKAKSQEKLQKVYDLMKELQMMPEIKRKLMNTGFIEEFVAFVDMEQYPQDKPASVEAPEGGGNGDA